MNIRLMSDLTRNVILLLLVLQLRYTCIKPLYEPFCGCGASLLKQSVHTYRQKDRRTAGHLPKYTNSPTVCEFLAIMGVIGFTFCSDDTDTDSYKIKTRLASTLKLVSALWACYMCVTCLLTQLSMNCWYHWNSFTDNSGKTFRNFLREQFKKGDYRRFRPWDVGEWASTCLTSGCFSLGTVAFPTSASHCITVWTREHLRAHASCAAVTWSLSHHVSLMMSLLSGTSLYWITSSSSDSIWQDTIAWEPKTHTFIFIHTHIIIIIAFIMFRLGTGHIWAVWQDGWNVNILN